MAAGLEDALDFREYLDHAKVPRRPLQGHHVEGIVGKRQTVHVVDRGVNVQALAPRHGTTDLLHGATAVDRLDTQARLLPEEIDADHVRPGANPSGLRSSMAG